MLLDLLLSLAVAAFAVSGYRRGFLVGVLVFGGFLGGGLLGMGLAPRLLGEREPGPEQALAAVGVVLVAALLGQALLGMLGRAVRQRVTWRPVRLLDALLGAALSAAAVLVVAWVLASAVREASLPGVSRQVGESRVLTAVDLVLPEPDGGAAESFRDLLDAQGFPEVFAGLAPERIAPVDPPDRGVGASPEVRAAGRSVVEVAGAARTCRRQVEGSGFVYAPERVLTNAHVVAGVRAPVVRVQGSGPRYEARVVVYDPARDLAVLAVPGLRAPALSFDRGASRGDEAVVAGFPRGGPFRTVPARVREKITARGSDIYDEERVTREVLSLHADVEPGNSGGPVLSPDGRVYGVVFAKSRDDEDTGYALSIDETAPVADAGRRASTPVDTAGCSS